MTVFAATLFFALLQVPTQSKSSMDFWIGEWDVFRGGKKVGVNRIERTLGGAAIIEHWKDAGGGEGKSLFYWMADKKKWKQVWVTPDGAYKEKVAESVARGLVFTGTAYQANGSSYPDRTRLTLESDGTVRQVIEYSTGSSKGWQPVWDATYRKK